MTWDGLALVACAIGLASSAWFVLRFSLTAGVDAWRSPFGRFLLVSRATLAALFAAAIMNRVDVGWWADLREPVLALLLTAFAVQMIWPYRLLIKANEEAREKEEARR